MLSYHIIGTLTIPDGAIIGDARLWVDCVINLEVLILEKSGESL